MRWLNIGDFILVLDIGTTNIKAFLFDREGSIISEARRRPIYIMDEPGQVEQDPTEIWDMCKGAISEVLTSKNLNASDIDSMAISTQRASFCLWNKKTRKLVFKGLSTALTTIFWIQAIGYEVMSLSMLAIALLTATVPSLIISKILENAIKVKTKLFWGSKIVVS